MARYQQRPGWCGPAAIQSALEVYGDRLSQSKLARACGTDDSGTDEHGILGAVIELGYKWDEISTDRRSDASSWLLSRSPVVPLVLCVDSWEHWICVTGVCGSRLVVTDSTNEEWNTAQLGRHIMTPKQLLRRWCAASENRREGGLYYGIAILPK